MKITANMMEPMSGDEIIKFDTGMKLVLCEGMDKDDYDKVFHTLYWNMKYLTNNWITNNVVESIVNRCACDVHICVRANELRGSLFEFKTNTVRINYESELATKFFEYQLPTFNLEENK